MIELVDFLRWLHVLGACVLLGTGAGIAFFMLAAHRTRDVYFIAHTAKTVVVADMIFTATAAIAQPITGTALAWKLGWYLTEPWLAISVALYIFIGVLWLPVVVIQNKMRDEAFASLDAGSPLSVRYQQLFRAWLVRGIPAFLAIVILLWLMLMRPSF